MTMIARYIGVAGLTILFGTVLNTCWAQPGMDSLSFDRHKVAAALQSWTASQPGKRGKLPPYTLLFTTTTGACTPCCAAAINYAIGTVKRFDIAIPSLVVVATSVPREGLALRRKFKADMVAEDVSDVLASVFRADPVYPNMYLIDSAGNVVMYRHDLQHNSLDTFVASKGLSVNVKKAKMVKARSSVPLIEDDDNIIGDAKSVTLDASKGEIEILESRQNAIYYFSARTGKMIAAVPPDTSLSLYFKKPTDDPEYWRSLVEHYPAMVKYEAIARRKNNDTSYIFADLFTGYSVAVGAKNDTTIQWHKGMSILKMFNRKLVGVSPVAESEYFIIGTPQALGNDFLSYCLWAGASDSIVSDRFRRDSSFDFLLIKEDGSAVKPVVSTVSLEDRLGVVQEANHRGSLCVAGAQDLFYLSQYNKVFMHGKRVGDDIVPEFWKLGGTLAGMVVDHKVSGEEAGYASGDSVFVVDMASDGDRLYVLAVSRYRRDTKTRLYMQVYDLSGRFIDEHPIVTGDEKILSVQVIRCEAGVISMLVKREKTRWRIDNFSVVDFISSSTR